MSSAAFTDRARRGAISAIEVVVVLVILGLLAVLSIPRSSQAVDRSPAASLRADLTILRTAIALYCEDHAHLPGTGPAAIGLTAGEVAVLVVRQLTMASDIDGNVSPERDETHPFGPYLRGGIPAPTVRGVRVSGGISIAGTPPTDAENGARAGWLYDPQTGCITVNAEGFDPQGVPYEDY